MDKRIFLSVLAALVVFGLLIVGWRALERERDIEDAQAAMQQIADQLSVATRQVQQETAAQRRAVELSQQAESLRSMRERDRALLADDQRCIGGTVIAVKGSTYTQALGAGRMPIPCAGRLANQPLR
jgi:hypothetical protein